MIESDFTLSQLGCCIEVKFFQKIKGMIIRKLFVKQYLEIMNYC